MKTELVFASGKNHAADLFIAGFFENAAPASELSRLEPLLPSLAKAAADKKRFSGKSGETLSSYDAKNLQAPEMILIGLGAKKDFKKTSLRKIAGQITKIALDRKVSSARVFLPSFMAGEVNANVAASIFTEISALAAYDFKKYKTESAKKSKAPRSCLLELLVSNRSGEPALRKQMQAAQIVADGVIFARDLINEPANVLTPAELSERARAMAEENRIHCKILGAADLARLKMNGILAVNQGSVHPPALIILEHGRSYQSKGTICLVGKGVTFDTGGLSIKPSKGMEKMKYDMSGAAAVLGIMKAAAGLKLPVHLVALAPAVENNVAQDPQRPGDIIRMYNGKTVEVLNTDAEGRLILADALAYSARYSPKVIVDMATLTGMCAYTFGNQAIGLMGNNEKVLDLLKRAGQQTGERCWELPIWEEYAQQIKGQQSDLKNIGGEYAGTITAAMFLKEFVPEKTAWAHLDIAGTAWCDSPRFDCQHGATGVGVRLLVQMLSQWK